MTIIKKIWILNRKKDLDQQKLFSLSRDWISTLLSCTIRFQLFISISFWRTRIKIWIWKSKSTMIIMICSKDKWLNKLNNKCWANKWKDLKAANLNYSKTEDHKLSFLLIKDLYNITWGHLSNFNFKI